MDSTTPQSVISSEVEITGTIKSSGSVRIDGKPPRVDPSPMLGQHTDDVLTTWLGLSAADVEALRGGGVL